MCRKSGSIPTAPADALGQDAPKNLQGCDSLMPADNVLRENEVKANRIMAGAMLLAFTFGIVTLFLTHIDYFNQPRVSYWPALMVSTELLLLAGAVLCLHFKAKPKWMKSVLFTIMIISTAVVNGLFAPSAALLMSIPVILSLRYFSAKFTFYVALITFAAFLVSAVWGANAGVPNLNDLELPEGTVIRMDGTTWLEEAVESIPYDTGKMIWNSLLYDFLPDTLIFLVISAAGVRIAKQGRELILRQQELTSKTARIDTELELAARIQADALPSVFPAFPERTDFDICASMTPAKEVGGDFYDFFLIDDTHLGIVMADVSDKGVPAALFMMNAKTLVQNYAMTGLGPAEVLRAVNEQICLNNRESMFVTVWFGILDLATGRLAAANAGHEYPALKPAGRRFELFRDRHGFVIGCMKGLTYQEEEVELTPGARLFVYTDGITEAENPAGEMFGTGRMTAALNEEPEAAPEQILANLRRRVDEFVQEAPQSDDMTMLCLEYKGTGGNANVQS